MYWKYNPNGEFLAIFYKSLTLCSTDHLTVDVMRNYDMPFFLRKIDIYKNCVLIYYEIRTHWTLFEFYRIIQNLLSNRRFYVELNIERSRWRLQKNGLPHASVLSPILFNICTNDQPIHDGTRSFIYADDLCICVSRLWDVFYHLLFYKTTPTLIYDLVCPGDSRNMF